MRPFWKEYDLPAMRAESHFGDRVALFISNKLEFVLAYFARQRLGAMTVPVSICEQAS